MKIFLLITIACLSINFSSGQDCPTRIGDFILNETTISKLPKICSYCDTKYISSIRSGDEFLTYEVSYDDLNESYSGTTSYYELLVDTSSIGGWYTRDYATFNDSVRVLFIPNYVTDGMSIKNVVLKFYNDTLYFMRASLSNEYRQLLTEKYKGKGNKTVDKKTKNKCKNVTLQKYPDTYLEYSFSSDTDSTTFARLIMESEITKDCEFNSENRIEIFNSKNLIKVLGGGIEDVKKFIEEKKIRLKKEKEIKLERF